MMLDALLRARMDVLSDQPLRVGAAGNVDGRSPRARRARPPRTAHAELLARRGETNGSEARIRETEAVRHLDDVAPDLPEPYDAEGLAAHLDPRNFVLSTCLPSWRLLVGSVAREASDERDRGCSAADRTLPSGYLDDDALRVAASTSDVVDAHAGPHDQLEPFDPARKACPLSSRCGR